MAKFLVAILLVLAVSAYRPTGATPTSSKLGWLLFHNLVTILSFSYYFIVQFIPLLA